MPIVSGKCKMSGDEVDVLKDQIKIDIENMLRDHNKGPVVSDIQAQFLNCFNIKAIAPTLTTINALMQASFDEGVRYWADAIRCGGVPEDFERVVRLIDKGGATG